MCKVIHVMSDGSIRQDITGIVVPLTKTTEIAYKTIADIVKRGGLNNEKQAGA